MLPVARPDTKTKLLLYISPPQDDLQFQVIPLPLAMSLAPGTSASMSALTSTSKAASLAPTTADATSDKPRWDDAVTRYSTTEDDDDTNVINYSSGVDVAVDLVSGASTDNLQNVDPASAAAMAVRRKIDWQLLPLLFFLYTG